MEFTVTSLIVYLLYPAVLAVVVADDIRKAKRGTALHVGPIAEAA